MLDHIVKNAVLMAIYAVGAGFICRAISCVLSRHASSCSYLSLAARYCDVNESAGVHHSLVCAALWLLLLLLRLNLFRISASCPSFSCHRNSVVRHICDDEELSYLWCLRLDLSGTSEGSVDFTHDCEVSIEGW